MIYTVSKSLYDILYDPFKGYNKNTLIPSKDYLRSPILST